jgi:hypothetical protein
VALRIETTTLRYLEHRIAEEGKALRCDMPDTFPPSRLSNGGDQAASTPRPAAFHSGKPSSSRRALKPRARSASTASKDSTQ